jgi:hypothetical protein
VTTTVLTPTKPLVAADRCDRCGAPAYVRVVLTGGELLFCAHHGKQYDEQLRKIAVEIHDESDRLVATPAGAGGDDER